MVLKVTNENYNFQGLEVLANYGGIAFFSILITNQPKFSIIKFKKDWRPYSWMDGKSNVYGFMKDVMDVACNYLNLTLVIKDTRNVTNNTWYKK